MAKKKTTKSQDKDLPAVVDASGNPLELPFPVEAGSKGALVAHLMQSMDIARHTDRNDIDSLRNSLIDYLSLCARNNINVTNMGVYGALGLSQETISQWASGNARGTSPEYREFAQFVRKLCAQYRELAASENKLNVALAIWWQKNYDGLRDDPVVEKASDNVQVPVDPQTIAEKYQHLLERDSGARMEAERAKRVVAVPEPEDEEDEE